MFPESEGGLGGSCFCWFAAAFLALDASCSCQ